MWNQVKDSLNGNYDPISSISISYASSLVSSGEAETDIIYQQGSIPYVGAIGITWCDDAVNGALYACDQQYVRFVNNSIYERRYLACHETGHALGLLHGDDADPKTPNQSAKMYCMKAEFSPNDYSLWAQ